MLFRTDELGAHRSRRSCRASYAPIERQYDAAFEAGGAAADRLLDARRWRRRRAQPRTQRRGRIREAQRGFEAARRDGARAGREPTGGDGASDTNYIFLTFVTQHLPAGLVGLVLAVIFGATMSSISAEMNALATVSIVDIYKRHVRTDATDRHYLTPRASATVFWGCYAVVCAQYVKRHGLAGRSGERARVVLLRRDAFIAAA